jgi:lipopolysaccharide transport system ATP-binding protein
MNIITVLNLSKRYRIGVEDKKSQTVVGAFLDYLKFPFSNFNKIRSLNSFDGEEDSSFWALKNINFEIKNGEVLGIIGKNGAGKSTLLKILSQITEPSSGKVKIFGRVASLLEVGTGFHPELSGRENIYMNGTILGMTKKEIDSKLDEIIDFSGVEKFIDTPVKFYSSGMKVRLGFSVAAHLDPEVLIVDEVLAVGDFEFQNRCLGKLENLSKDSGRTVLFVSHQLAMISFLCTRTILMNDGQIVFDGDTKKAISLYLNQSDLQKSQVFENFFIDGNRSILLSSVNFDSTESRFFSNQCFVLKIGFSLLNSRSYTNARVDIRIDDVYGNGLIWLTSKTNLDIDFLKGEIQFEIEKLPLLPGEYFITIYFHDGISVSSHYSRVLSFFVDDSDYFERKVKIPQGQTQFFVPFKVYQS